MLFVWDHLILHVGLQILCVYLCQVLCFQYKVSLCSSDWPGTHHIDQAGLELKDLLASAHIMKSKTGTTVPRSLPGSLGNVTFWLVGWPHHIELTWI